MTRIWSVKYTSDCGDDWDDFFFTTYGAAVKSIQKSYPNQTFPPELEVTDKTRIGFRPILGEWISLEAVLVHSEPIKII